LTPSKAEDISDELIRKLQFLETRFGAAQALPEWPSTMLIALEAFGLSAVSIVLPQVVAPIFRSVVGVLFGIPLPSA